MALPHTSPAAGTTSSFEEISPLQSPASSRDDDLFPTLSLHVGFCDIEQRLTIAFPHSAVIVSHVSRAFPFPPHSDLGCTNTATWQLHQGPSWSLFPATWPCLNSLPSETESHFSGPQPRLCRTGLGALWAAQHPQGPSYSTGTAMPLWELEGDLQTQQGCARHQWFWSQHKTDSCISVSFSFKTAARQSWQLRVFPVYSQTSHCCYSWS